MKKVILPLLLAFVLPFLSSSAQAQVIEKFNTRPGATNLPDIKPWLQNRCWFFVDMDVNNGNWNPGIEGDGAMVSGATSTSEQGTGIYTPYLDLAGNLTVSFSYKFNNSASHRRWLKLYLIDFENNIHSLLDSVELDNRNNTTTYTYNKSFNNVPSGGFKLFINYQGIGGSTRIGIDNIQIAQSLLYTSGCNDAPIAVDDIIGGASNHTASGYLCSNDYDPNGDYFTCYITSNSADGIVNMNSDGSFSFSPNPGFAGSSTTFTYQVCDNGFSPLCSNTATATINFPAAGMLPAKLIEFIASVNDERTVNIRWTTTVEQGSERFEIERSLDGGNFQKIGVVKAAGTSGTKTPYSFNDKLSASTANKKDVYYRLRLVDVNSRAEISKVLIVRLFRSESTRMISVTPNPVKNDINVQVQLKENSYIVMKITNNVGTEVMRKSLRGNAGYNVFAIDGTGSLQPGAYMLEIIINSNERMTTKLIKN